MRATVRERAAKLVAYVLQFKELVALLVLMVTWGASPYLPDLEITWSVSPLLLPEQVGGAKPDRQRDRELLTVKVRNTGDQAVTIQDLRIHGIRSASSAGLRSSAPNIDDKAAEFAQYSLLPEGVIKLTNTIELARGHNVELQFSADVSRVLWGDRVVAVTTAKSVGVRESSDITGFSLFVYRNASMIWGFALTVVVIIGAKRVVQKP